jgi:hypothetical protein
MSPSELLIVLTISATLATVYAKQLNDTKDLELKQRLNTIVQGDNWRREYAYSIMFDDAKQPSEAKQRTQEELVEIFLQLEELDPAAAARLIQQICKSPEQS